MELGSISTLTCVTGALMLIAWMNMGSLGMMVARYLKGVAKGTRLFGKDVWFLVRLQRYNNIPHIFVNVSLI